MSQFLAFDHNPHHVLVSVVSHLQIESFLSLMKPRYTGYLLSQRIVDLTVSTCHAALLALMARHFVTLRRKRIAAHLFTARRLFLHTCTALTVRVVGPNTSPASLYALPLPFYVLG